MTDPVEWSMAVGCNQCWRGRLGDGRDAESRIRETVDQLHSQGVRCTASKGCLGLCDYEQGFIVRGSNANTVTTAWIGDIRTAPQMKELCRWLKRNEDPSTLPVGRLLASTTTDGRPGSTYDVLKELELRLRVVDVREEAQDIRSIFLEAADGQSLPQWTPGAHIDVGLPGNLVRQYSLCGGADSTAPWRIAVLREPRGRGGSIAIHETWSVGDVILARGPRNNFGLEDADRYIFIAGGIGITPILPMIQEIESRGLPWTLAYGGRSRRSMAFLNELRQFGPAVEVLPEDRYGLLPLDQILETPSDSTLVYCCGPPRLLTATRHAAKNWPVENVVFEQFTTGAIGDDQSADLQFEVVAATSGLTVTVNPGSSILEALQEHGLFPIAACRSGVCGSCETGVISGEPEHRDALLSQEERNQNRSMMICVSRSHSERMILDL